MSGYVYFITPEAVLNRTDYQMHVVKIGYTRRHPISRLKDLQCGSPAILELFGYIEGSKATERAFHETFAPLNSHGEWFYLQHKLHDFLCCLENYHTPEYDRFIPRESLDVAIFDAINAECSPHPSVTDDEYLDSAVMGFFRAPQYARGGALCL